MHEYTLSPSPDNDKCFDMYPLALDSDEYLICLLNDDNSPFLKEVLSTLVSEGRDRLRIGEV